MAEIVFNTVKDVKDIMEAFRRTAQGEYGGAGLTVSALEPIIAALIRLAEEADRSSAAALVKLPGGGRVSAGEVASIHVALVEMESRVIVTTKQGVKIVVEPAGGKTASATRDEVAKLCGG